MWQTLLGVALALLPLAAVACFPDRRRGLIMVGAVAPVGHVTLALVLMGAGLFSYPVVLAAHAAVGLACLGAAVFARREAASGLWPGWAVVVALVLALVALALPHVRHEGPVDTALGPRVVSASAYPFPLYSDEWVAVAMARRALEVGELPLANPFDGKPFLNFLAGFHAGLAEVDLFLAADPLLAHAPLAVANGFLACLFAYAIARLLGARRVAAALLVAAVPLVTSAGNLPGLLYLMPHTAALTLLLAAIAAFLAGARWAGRVAIVGSLLVYPPYALFAVPALVGSWFLGPRGTRLRSAAADAGALLLVAAAVALVAASLVGWRETFSAALAFAVRERLDPGVVYFLPWLVLPLPVIALALVGLPDLWRRRALTVLLPLAAAALIWAIQAFLPFVLVAEPSRAVVLAAVLLAAPAALGLEKILALLEERFPGLLAPWVGRAAAAAGVLALALALLLYPRLELWRGNVLAAELPTGERAALVPAPPVTRYLTPDDLRLFAGARGERLVAPPWKGLAIGVATGVTPLETKPSTVATFALRFRDFMAADCAGRSAMAKRRAATLVYAPAFSCPGFEAVGESREGLTLYRVVAG